MSNLKNNSKYYYLSNQNMSDIKESIDEYSMNFEKQSNAQSKYHNSISQDIEYSRTNKLASQSIQDKNISKKNTKNNIPPSIPQSIPTQQSQHNLKKTTSQKILQAPAEMEYVAYKSSDRPYDLGFSIWEIIHQRYSDTNKITTEDPDVLYDFYISQKKTVKQRPLKAIEQDFAKLQKLMPSMKKKQQVRLNFQKILSYRPNDVCYTLQIAAHAIVKDREFKKNNNILNAEMKKQNKKKKVPVDQIVNRLYGQTNKSSGFKNPQELDRIKLIEFGKKLSESYQNAMRQIPEKRVETLANLHHYWQQLHDERQYYGLQWDEEKVENDIRRYMISQVQILKHNYCRKIGYNQDNGNKLYKFLVQNPLLPDVFIPANSFQSYANVYSLHIGQKEEEFNKKQKQNHQKIQSIRAKSQVKKFGRPVSATPLQILSKPKKSNNYLDLYSKYNNDKLLKTLVQQERLKVPRYPFEYGVHDMVQQLKIKERIKPKVHEDYDKAIDKMLTKTINNQSSFYATTRQKDRVSEMLSKEDVYKDQNWKQMSDLLQQAMLVKSFQQEWFRQPIVKYVKQTTTKDLQYSQDKLLFRELFKYLDKLNEDDRQSQLQKLQRFIQISQKIQNTNKQVHNLQNKNQNYYLKERKLMYVDLVQRVIHFQRLKNQIREGKTSQKLNKREFINETYSLLLKSHKDAVKKYFNFVDIKDDKQCPKLLRYEFYRLAKEINPITFQRDQNPKAPHWIATKQSPQSFNYKTYSKYANAYAKNKNKLISDPEDDKKANSFWGRKNVKDRQNLLMTYSDAKQCYFHPKVKKMI